MVECARSTGFLLETCVSGLASVENVVGKTLTATSRADFECRDPGTLHPFRLLQASSGFHSGPVLCRWQRHRALTKVADQDHVACLSAA